jgi:hypothetical protein
MARPKKDDGAERLSAFAGFQCKPSEKAELRARAERAGIDLSPFLRIVSLSDLKAPIAEVRNVSAIRELTACIADLGERITAARREGDGPALEDAARAVQEAMLEITRL